MKPYGSMRVTLRPSSPNSATNLPMKWPKFTSPKAAGSDVKITAAARAMERPIFMIIANLRRRVLLLAYMHRRCDITKAASLGEERLLRPHAEAGRCCIFHHRALGRHALLRCAVEEGAHDGEPAELVVGFGQRTV